jgi:hypothetical protein
MLTAPCNCSSSLQAAVASHETGLQFRFSFIPTEPGPHHVTLRLEYYDEATTLEGIERPEEVPPCVPSVSVPVPVSEAAAAGLEPGGQVGLGLVVLRIFSPFNPLGLVSILNPATIRFLRLIHPTGGVCVCKYLGLEFAGSPFQVVVPDDAPRLSPRAYHQLPVRASPLGRYRTARPVELR